MFKNNFSINFTKLKEEIEKDFEILRMMYPEDIEIINDNIEKGELNFIVNLKKENEIDKNIENIVKEFGFEQLLIDSSNIYLPYFIQFNVSEFNLEIIISINWMKKQRMKIRNFLENYKINNDSVFYSFIQDFSEILNEIDKNAIISWLEYTKEEYVGNQFVDLFKCNLYLFYF